MIDFVTLRIRFRRRRISRSHPLTAPWLTRSGRSGEPTRQGCRFWASASSVFNLDGLQPTFRCALITDVGICAGHTICKGGLPDAGFPSYTSTTITATTPPSTAHPPARVTNPWSKDI